MTKHSNLSEEGILSRLSEFRHLCTELTVLNILIDKQISKLPDYQIKEFDYSREHDLLITFLLDAAVIRLVRLYIVQPTIGRVLKEKTDDGTKLLDVLSDLWDNIHSHKDKIKKIWRDRIIAHSEEQIRDYKPYHILDPEYNETLKNILSSIRWSANYYIAIQNYAGYLFDEADIHFKIKFDEADELTIKKYWNKLNVTEKKVIRETNIKLRKNGFMEIPIPNYDATRNS